MRRLPHPAGEQDLAERVVELVRARCGAGPRASGRSARRPRGAVRRLGERQRRGPAARSSSGGRRARRGRPVAAEALEGPLELLERRHERLGREASAVGAEVAFGGAALRRPHDCSSVSTGASTSRTDSKNCLHPAFVLDARGGLDARGDVHGVGRTRAIAAPTLPASRPPARISGTGQVRPARTSQSNGIPVPRPVARRVQKHRPAAREKPRGRGPPTPLGRDSLDRDDRHAAIQSRSSAASAAVDLNAIERRGLDRVLDLLRGSRARRLRPATTPGPVTRARSRAALESDPARRDGREVEPDEGRAERAGRLPRPAAGSARRS